MIFSFWMASVNKNHTNSVFGSWLPQEIEPYFLRLKAIFTSIQFYHKKYICIDCFLKYLCFPAR